MISRARIKMTWRDLKTWAKDLWEAKDGYCIYEYECKMQMCAPEEKVEPTRFRYARELFVQFGRRLRCVLTDHVLVDNGSYANGNSGGEGYRCTRCGWTWWHQWY